MQLILFDSLLWTEWISFILSVTVFGFFVLFEDKLTPDQFKRIYKYGKSAELHKKSAIGKFELPKSWFCHFYLFATFFYSYLLVSLIQVYFFEQNIPSHTKYLLDSVVGINRKARVSSESVFLSLILILIQVIRRLAECFLVSVYSKAKMNLIHYIFGVSYYFGVGLSVLAEANGLNQTYANESCFISFKNFFLPRHIIGTFIFIIASYLHNNSHHILASLRKDKNGNVVNYKHVIPTGGLFEYVSCPHYFAEILIYVSIAIVQGGLNYTWWLVMSFVIVNQIIMGKINHQWYLSKFENYPKNRKAVVPFLI